MIYGYSLKPVNKYGLLEMKEVSFVASPQILRDIATFLNSMAALMESGGFDGCSHRHIGNTINDWNRRFPEKDIIVAPPRE